MRKFFNSGESYAKEKEKNRLQARRLRRAKRAQVLKSVQFELESKADSSKLAEVLASQVFSKQTEEEKKFEISLEVIETNLNKLD